VKKRVYIFFSDPGHGWIKVSRAEINKLGIGDKISRCSYQRGNFVYLEEDGDATLFSRTKQACGELITYVERYSNRLSKIRSYESYSFIKEA
jgi:hypothetical protein